MIKTFEQYTALNKLTKTAKSAAEQLADGVLEDIYWDFLKNATDLDESDNNEITWIISLANDDQYFFNDLNAALYSIKDIFQKKKHIRCVDVIDQWVDDNWEEFLDEDTVDALRDLFDTGGILGKKQLNGGRFESYRDFQMLVADNVINKIKESLAVKDHDDDDDDDEEDDD
jgi:hypothetical protein